MKISEKQIMQLILYAHQYIVVCLDAKKDSVAKDIGGLIYELTNQQSDDLMDIE